MKKRPPISDEERDLFRAQLGGVKPLKQDTTPQPPPKKLLRIKRSPTAISPALPLPSLGDEYTLTPVQAADFLFFARPGLQAREIHKLRRGDIEINAKLDLHGLTVAQAHITLNQFLAHAIAAHYRYILIIHGKGSRGENTLPTLKNRVNFWLREYTNVLAFCTAKPNHGGTGAVYVRLTGKLA